MTEKVYAVYRRRIPYVEAVPYEASRHDVICALFGAETEVKHWNNRRVRLGTSSGGRKSQSLITQTRHIFRPLYL